MLVFKGEGALVLVTHDFEEAALLRGCFNSVGAVATHGEGVSA
jgi:ABC-type nitrate/sulfonate/bicarbonate transport system ATPase subunit